MNADTCKVKSTKASAIIVGKRFSFADTAKSARKFTHLRREFRAKIFLLQSSVVKVLIFYNYLRITFQYLGDVMHEERNMLLHVCSFRRPFNTVGALERAKLAVEKHYAVVGVLEDMNTTLTVLENYIPRFFQGATDVYYGKEFVNFCLI